jgi:hypothetical protein
VKAGKRRRSMNGPARDREMLERQRDIMAFLMSRLGAACADDARPSPVAGVVVACTVLQFVGIAANPLPVRVMSVGADGKVDLLAGRWDRDVARVLTKPGAAAARGRSVVPSGVSRPSAHPEWPGHLAMLVGDGIWDPSFAAEPGGSWPGGQFEAGPRWIVPRVSVLLKARTRDDARAVYWLSDAGNSGWRRVAEKLRVEIRRRADRLIAEYLRTLAFFDGPKDARFVATIQALENIEKEVLKSLGARRGHAADGRGRHGLAADAPGLAQG